jgi:hypothetical protein
MAILLMTALFIAGSVALRIGLRGRRIDDHPLCRRCGFDLTGKPAESCACAECGADLSAVKAVRIGHRRRLTGWVVGGFLLLLVALVAAAFDVAGQTQAIRLIQFMPVKWLLYESKNGSPSSRFDALSELLNHAQNGKFTPFQTAATIDVALTMQGDSSKGWDTLWGDIIELRRGKSQVTDRQWATYCTQALRGAFTLRVRPIVRLGDPIPYRVDLNKTRTATATRLLSMLSFNSMEVSGFRGAQPVGLSVGPSAFTGVGWVGSTFYPKNIPRNFQPGTHEMHLVASVKIGEPNGANGLSPVVSQTVDLRSPVNVVTATQSTVKAVADPKLAVAIRQNLSLELRARIQPNFL